MASDEELRCFVRGRGLKKILCCELFLQLLGFLCVGFFVVFLLRPLCMRMKWIYNMLRIKLVCV